VGELPGIRQPRGPLATLHGRPWSYSGPSEAEHLDTCKSQLLRKVTCPFPWFNMKYQEIAWNPFVLDWIYSGIWVPKLEVFNMTRNEIGGIERGWFDTFLTCEAMTMRQSALTCAECHHSSGNGQLSDLYPTHSLHCQVSEGYPAGSIKQTVWSPGPFRSTPSPYKWLHPSLCTDDSIFPC
jgi:hypothetical protein